MIEAVKDLLIISKRWGTGRGRFTSVERFCAMLDPGFDAYQGSRIHLHPRLSLFFKQRTNSLASSDYNAPYNSFSFELELWGLKAAFQRRYRYVFFPYADYDYYYWRYFKKLLGLKVILWTFFSVRELEERFGNLGHFTAADLVLAAGRSQQEYILQHATGARVEFFPIGVDTDFFQPGNQPDRLRLVHVGNNRRDYATLVRGLDIVQAAFPTLQVDLVGAFTARERIPERTYLTIHELIDDEAYLCILQRANFSILSLEDGGSSNSLLEAIAAGLPVVVTDLPNVRDYFDDSCALRYARGDAEGLAAGCMRLLSELGLRDRMSKAARTHAERYSWHLLSNRFNELLASIN